MASTIKLKTSTSSGNVPASLSKGEVAINVADGVWYYGGNSAVQQNFTFGRITVTGDTNLDGKLVVTGNTVMNGTLSATTRLQVGNGDGLISGHTTSSINSTVGNVLNITGGDGAITFEGASSIKIPDNTSSALVIEEANNAYLSFFTTNASPVIQVHQPQVNTNTLTVGVDGTGHDVKFFGDTAGQYMLWDESADKLIVTGEIEATKFDGALEGNADTATKIASITNDNIVQLAGAQTLTGTKTLNSFKGTGSVTVTDIKDTDNFSDASATSLATSESIKAYVDSKDHDANTLQEVTTAGATSNVAITLSNDLTVGVDDTGHDVKFFGATSGAYMLWDQSADDLIIAGAGGLSVDGVTNLDNTDIDGTFTMDGTAFDVNGTTTVAIDNTNTTNGVTINTVTSGSKVFIGHTTSETTVNDNLTVTGALTMGTTAAMTSSGLLSVGTQSNITRVGTLSELTVDNVNIDTNTITSTSGGLTVTATEGRVLLLGGAESPINALSDVSLNGNLVVTGNTVMNGSLSATTSCKIGNGDGLISAATIDSITQKVGNGTSFKPRPNLYWFGNCDAATVGPASDGSFPATNTTDVSWGETYNSHATVFSASSDQVQIVRGGLYKVTYNVTLEGGADGSASNRTGGGIALLRKVAGGTYAVVDGTESYVYCRINNIERNTGTVSVVCNVTANDVFKIVFIRTGVQTSSSKLGTVTAGTAWTIEAVS